MEIRKAITLRFGIVYFAIALFGLVIVARILIIQNVDTQKWQEIAKDLRSNTTEIWAKRGNICADDGSILSTSVPYYEIRMDLMAPRIQEIFTRESENMVGELSNFFGFSKDEFRSRLQAAYAKKNRWFLVNPEQMDHNKFQEFKLLKTMSKSYFGSGIIVVTENRRILPHGDLASRTIGVLNKGAFGGVHGNVGYTGVEGLAESYLAGINGLALKRNFSGNWTNIPIIEPKEGKDVITTLNVNLQDYAQTALGKRMEETQADWGTAIVMEVKTGAIKAIANMGLKKDGTYGETYNFAFGHAGCSEPGSTFKLMSMIVAMEEGYVDTADMFDTGRGIWEYRGQKMLDSDYDHGGHGYISMKQIFELSSNIGTAKIITKFYEGKEKDFIDRIYSFGLNKQLGLGFLGEAEPRIKYPTDPDWWGPSLAWICHGYEIKISPIQTLTFYNAVANNGKMVKPKFIEEVREDGIPVRKFSTEVLNPSICSKTTLSKAQAMLKGVCIRGTGKNLKNPYYTIAGKTGTAVIANENKGYVGEGGKRYQASFCGYFPADNPLYSCIVVIVGPKGQSVYGGSVAGPVFRSIADKVYAAYLEPARDSIPPYKEVPQVKPGLKEDVVMLSRELGFKTQVQNLTSDHVAVNADSMTVFVSGVNDSPGIVPDVVGMGAADAVYLMEREGLKVESKGFGRVYRQSPIAGSPFVKGDMVSLDLGFDDLQIVKRDSLIKNDSIQMSMAAAMPAQPEPEPDQADAPPQIVAPVKPAKAKPEATTNKKTTAKSKTSGKQNATAKTNATNKTKAAQNSAAKQKPSPEAIKKWKAKVAAQKAAQEKKSKPAAKKATTKKATAVQPKKQQR
ncbi:MAG TPA: penicillin-binding transpeptidase domain-containing protein [Prolixibacteraceae bacterium]|nr:penicillin-binding transpeptidase domain-containing protein [Prolixibacteraceae bacterium]